MQRNAVLALASPAGYAVGVLMVGDFQVSDIFICVVLWMLIFILWQWADWARGFRQGTD